MGKDSSEILVRAALLDHLKSREQSDCVFLTELTVAGFARRADLVLANGHLAVFEIKSAADKLSRLEGQLACYERNFEATTVVCANKHLDGVLKLVSKGTGVITIAEDGGCHEVQTARYRRIPKDSWLGYLPVVELRKLLRLQGKHAVKQADRRELLQACKRLKVDAVREYTLAYIKLRDLRNSKLREAAEKKRSLRLSVKQPEVASVPSWLEAFSSMGPLVAIPRKVS
ncbi:sce7726 family protein [Alcaligenes faecalis subsp. phenolicus]|uniref:sce7726 family protein n=1 Tax=Alcaligenes nematophilus TaxID=2994643 RepID=UPI002AA4AB13|nr:sce7726 family protein [Alcaligenes phenolicus]